MAGVSLLAQLNTQLSRFDKLTVQFDDLQRALTTNKKTTTYRGLGDDALSSLRVRTDLTRNESYIQNIDIATTRMKIMDTTVGLIQKQVENVRAAFVQQSDTDGSDYTSYSAFAAKLMEAMPGNLNEEVDGRYVFAGGDTSSKPYNGTATLKGIVESDLADWKDGTITTATLLTRINNYTDDQVGFTPEVLAAGSIQVTASDNYKLDYTLKASDPDIKSVLVAGQVLASISTPTETDAATVDDLKTVLDAMQQKLTSAAQGIEADAVTLKASIATIGEIRQTHNFDKALLEGLVEDIENVDINETAVKLQNVQLQLEASYSITSLTSSLSLLNYLN